MRQFDFKKVDWRQFEAPSPLFKVLRRTEDKDKLIAHELKNGFLNLDDSYRNYESIYKLMNYYFYHSFSIFYEVGRENKFQALLGITDIIPLHKASVMFKIIDKTFWGKDFVRETRSLLELYMKELELKRVSAESPDPRIVKMAKMAGFKVEGIINKDFMWDEKYYDNFLLGFERKQ